MDPREAYNIWATQYDTNENKTRDLEAEALREMVKDLQVKNILELGCGTGKNTSFLMTIADVLTAVDFSEEMLSRAREKISSSNVQFIQADVKKSWDLLEKNYDLVTFSLVLEHIENLNEIFSKAAAVLRPGGYLYIGELHPFKQYIGTKARFEHKGELKVVQCFNHHLSDFFSAGKNNGLSIKNLKEYFDEDNKEIPRVLTIVFRKE